MRIQRSPFICEDERNETALLDQFYVETDSEYTNKYFQLTFFISNFTLNSKTRFENFFLSMAVEIILKLF